jgi:hypothetical protein
MVEDHTALNRPGELNELGANTEAIAQDRGDKAAHTRKLVSRAEAARILTEAGFPISPATLAKKAVTGRAPLYRVWNRRAMYEVPRLLDWADSKLGPELLSTAQRHQ